MALFCACFSNYYFVPLLMFVQTFQIYTSFYLFILLLWFRPRDDHHASLTEHHPRDLLIASWCNEIRRRIRLVSYSWWRCLKLSMKFLFFVHSLISKILTRWLTQQVYFTFFHVPLFYNTIMQYWVDNLHDWMWLDICCAIQSIITF